MEQHIIITHLLTNTLPDLRLDSADLVYNKKQNACPVELFAHKNRSIAMSLVRHFLLGPPIKFLNVLVIW